MRKANIKILMLTIVELSTDIYLLLYGKNIVNSKKGE